MSTFFIATFLGLVLLGDSCIIQKWRDQPVHSPSRDITTRPTTTVNATMLQIKIKVARRPLNDLISNDHCGVSTGAQSFDPLELNPSGRIINGEKSNTNSWPWVVGIYVTVASDLFFRCSGALIDARYVLTSAYCVDEIPVANMAVSVGSNQIGRGVMYRVDGLKIHEDYNDDNGKKENDIAVLKLDKTVVFSSSVNSICLPSKDSSAIYNKNVVVTGWGSTDGADLPSSMSKTLGQIILTIFGAKPGCDDENKYCAYKRLGRNSNVCWRDLGAPLMYYTNNKWFIYGVLSSFSVDSTTNECNPSGPSYYTIVPNYLNWIAFNIESLQDQVGTKNKSKTGLGKIKTNNSNQTEVID